MFLTSEPSLKEYKHSRQWQGEKGDYPSTDAKLVPGTTSCTSIALLVVGFPTNWETTSLRLFDSCRFRRDNRNYWYMFHTRLKNKKNKCYTSYCRSKERGQLCFPTQVSDLLTNRYSYTLKTNALVVINTSLIFGPYPNQPIHPFTFLINTFLNLFAEYAM